MDTTSTKRPLPRQQSDVVPAPAQSSVMSASPQHNPPCQQPSYYSTRPPNNNQPDYRSNGAPASTVSLPPIQHLEPASMLPPQPYHHSHAELPRPHYQHNGEQYHHQYVSQPIPHRYEYQNGVQTLPSDVNGHGIVRYNIPMNPSANSRNKKEVKRRTKTGCLTCRKRRIKCDERHPECKNCEKSKRQCLGYDPTFKTTPGPPAIQPAPPYGSQMIKTEHLVPGYSNYGESPIYDSRVLPAAPLPPISSVNSHAHNMTNTMDSRPHRPPPAPMMSTHNNDSNYGELSAPLRRVGNGTNPG